MITWMPSLGGVMAQEKLNPWTVILQLNSVTTELLNATGAEVSVISESTYTAISSPMLSPPTGSLKGPSSYTSTQ